MTAVREMDPASARDLWDKMRGRVSAGKEAEPPSAGHTGAAPPKTPLPPHLEALGAQQWAGSTPDERIHGLQRLENHVAGQQHRTARPVVTDPGLGQAYGQFNTQENQLSLNPTLVGNGSSPYQAMQTVLHEGRHSLQWDAARGVPTSEASSATVQSWRDNYQAYNVPAVVPYHEYRFQPLEDDANVFATRSMESEAHNFADDPGYQQFLTSDAALTADHERRATGALGADFRQEIATDISARATQQRQAAQQGQGATHGQEAPQHGQGTQPGQVDMTRVRMSQPVPAAEAVGQLAAAQPVAWRGVRVSSRGSSLGGRGA